MCSASSDGHVRSQQLLLARGDGQGASCRAARRSSRLRTAPPTASLVQLSHREQGAARCRGRPRASPSPLRKPTAHVLAGIRLVLRLEQSLVVLPLQHVGGDRVEQAGRASRRSRRRSSGRRPPRSAIRSIETGSAGASRSRSITASRIRRRVCSAASARWRCSYRRVATGASVDIRLDRPSDEMYGASFTRQIV